MVLGGSSSSPAAGTCPEGAGHRGLMCLGVAFLAGRAPWEAARCVPHCPRGSEMVPASPLSSVHESSISSVGNTASSLSGKRCPPASRSSAVWGLSSGLLEPGDISALLQVPDALVVILLWASVAIGFHGGLVFLSVQSLYCFIVRLHLLPGSPCQGK